MDDVARARLRELVEQYGPDLADDPRRVRAILNDTLATHRREVSSLVAAAEEGVAADLKRRIGQQPDETLLTQLSQRLVRDHAMDADAARWAVTSWAEALGLEVGTAAGPGSREASTLAGETGPGGGPPPSRRRAGPVIVASAGGGFLLVLLVGAMVLAAATPPSEPSPSGIADATPTPRESESADPVATETASASESPSASASATASATETATGTDTPTSGPIINPPVPTQGPIVNPPVPTARPVVTPTPRPVVRPSPTPIPPPPNTPPTAKNDPISFTLASYSHVDLALLDNDLDPDAGAVIGYSDWTAPRWGTILGIVGCTYNNRQQYCLRYSQNGYVGPYTDTFQYLIYDDKGAVSGWATVTVTFGSQ